MKVCLTSAVLAPFYRVPLRWSFTLALETHAIIGPFSKIWLLTLSLKGGREFDDVVAFKMSTKFINQVNRICQRCAWYK